MTSTAPPTAIDRFGLILEDLCRSVAASRSRGVAGPLIVLIWGRLRRMAARFAAAARMHPTATPATHACAPRRGAASRPTASGPTRKARPPLPGGFGWLVRLTPEAAGYASQLQALLADPEMAALLSAAPRIGRILRPLCRMLALEPPRALLLPRRPARPPRISRTAPGPAAAPCPAAASVSPPAIPPSRWRPDRPDPWPD